MPNWKLRQGWARVAFGDVVRLSKERSRDPQADGFERFVGLEHLDSEDLKIRRWGVTADGTSFTCVFHPEQVLFGKRRAYQRKVAVAGFSGVCSSDIYVFEPKDRRLLTGLLPFIVQSNAFFEYALKTSAGSLSPRTNWKSLANYEFALPPLEEQRRITEALSAIKCAIDQLKDFEVVAGKMRASLLRTLLTYRQGWHQTTLGEVATVVGGGTPSTSIAEYWNGDIPWLTPTEVVEANGEVIYDSSRKISRDGLDNSSAKLIPVGSVLLTTRATIGAVAIAGRELTTNQGFQSLIPSERTSSKFLLLWCQNNLRQMISRASGSTFLEIPSSQVKKLQISLPPGMVQESIMAYMEAMDSSIRRAGDHVSLLRQLKSAIMREYLERMV